MERRAATRGRVGSSGMAAISRSRHPLHLKRLTSARVENEGTDDETFVPSDKAETALGEQRGEGHVVSSSNRIVRHGATPPSYHAKNRYLNILADGGEVTDQERARLLCTGGEKRGDEPDHIVFKFSSSGPTKALLAAPIVQTSTSSSARGGGYG